MLLFSVFYVVQAALSSNPTNHQPNESDGYYYNFYYALSAKLPEPGATTLS